MADSTLLRINRLSTEEGLLDASYDLEGIESKVFLDCLIVTGGFDSSTLSTTFDSLVEALVNNQINLPVDFPWDLLLTNLEKMKGSQEYGKAAASVLDKFRDSYRLSPRDPFAETQLVVSLGFSDRTLVLEGDKRKEFIEAYRDLYRSPDGYTGDLSGFLEGLTSMYSDGTVCIETAEQVKQLRHANLLAVHLSADEITPKAVENTLNGFPASAGIFEKLLNQRGEVDNQRLDLFRVTFGLPENAAGRDILAAAKDHQDSVVRARTMGVDPPEPHMQRRDSIMGPFDSPRQTADQRNQTANDAVMRRGQSS